MAGENLGSLKDCYVTQENGKKALAVTGGGQALDTNNVDVNGNPITVDEITRTTVSITDLHHEIHEGRYFTAWKNSLTGVTSVIMAFKVEPGQEKEPHMAIDWKTEESGSIAWYKGVTWTQGSGAAFTPCNSYDKHQGVKTSILQGDQSGDFISDEIVINPTGLNIEGAAKVFEDASWGTNQTTAAVHIGRRSEQVLEIGETYAIVIDCGNGGARIFLDWYEHIPKEST